MNDESQERGGQPIESSPRPGPREAGGEPGTGGSRDESDGGAGGAPGLVRLAVRGVLALAVLGLGIFAAYWFNATEGRAEAGAEAEEESARLVETATVRRETRRVAIEAMGTVVPAREVVIRPRVSGKIVRQAESFMPGGHLAEDELMVQIDRADYEQTIEQRESSLTEAEATLKIERGDQAVAREELELLQVDIAEINRDLILRKPQVNQARAAVKSAEAALRQATLDLDRTRITAPFDGQIVARSVVAGNNVSEGEQLATFVGSDRYWVEIAVPVSRLRWLDVPQAAGEPGSPARVTYRKGWGEGASREGHVARLIGELEAQSRLARLLVNVPDPLALHEEHEGRPQLVLGAFVDVRVQGRRLEDVVVMDRAHVREEDVVWVMNGSDRLETREVEVAFRGRDRAYISGGLDDGDRVVTTNLSAPVEGMLLRTAERSVDGGVSGTGEVEG